MKYALLLAFLFIGHAQANSCNEVKTSYYLYKAQSQAKKLLSCKSERCVVRTAQKLEWNVCKAVNHCDPLAAELNDPCLSDNTLTPEAREEIAQEAQAALDYLLHQGIEYLKSIGQILRGDDDEEDSEELLTDQSAQQG